MRSTLAHPLLYLDIVNELKSESGNWRCDMKRKGLVVGICLVLLLVFIATKVEARGCYNPLLLPFAVVGAVVGSVAVATTALVPGPVYSAYSGPGYYAPAPRCCGPARVYSRPVWTRGHYNGHGYWGPRHRW